jgi:hypothetical protein
MEFNIQQKDQDQAAVRALAHMGSKKPAGGAARLVMPGS